VKATTLLKLPEVLTHQLFFLLIFDIVYQRYKIILEKLYLLKSRYRSLTFF